jgi:hypothetical protein
MPVVINGAPKQKNVFAHDWIFGMPFPHEDEAAALGVVINGVNSEWS